MLEIIKTAILSFLPISEVRGGIPYGIYNNIELPYLLTIAILSNFLVVPLGYLFLDTIHKKLIKTKKYSKFFNYFVKKTRKKIEHKIGTKAEFIALYLLVAIPLPFTGSYTGTLAAWLFNLERKKSFLAIYLGIITAAIITTLITLGFSSFFS